MIVSTEIKYLFIGAVLHNREIREKFVLVNKGELINPEEYFFDPHLKYKIYEVSKNLTKEEYEGQIDVDRDEIERAEYERLKAKFEE